MKIPRYSYIHRKQILAGGIASAALLLSLIGCVPNRAYRDADSRPWEHTPAPPFVPGHQMSQYEPFTGGNSEHSYDLSYIEFDEQGDYWDRRQLGWTLEELKRVGRASNVVLVIYVHGWQNNASELRGHDVPKFRCLLSRLSAAQGADRRYFGVYIGWRGKSVTGGDGIYPSGSLPDIVSQSIAFLPHELSLFDRQSAATRVAGMPITEAIFSTVRASRTAAQSSGHLTKSIVIGHSFGALVVEKAMAEALAAEVIVNDPANGAVFPTPADFIVLLNSAAQSIYAKEMLDLLRRRHPPSAGGGGLDEISADHPLIVSVTSTADLATGILFPIGTGISNATNIFRRYEWDEKCGDSSHNVNQRQYFTTTPGHNGYLISHKAIPEGVPSLPVLDDESATCDPGVKLTGVARNLQEPLTGPGGNARFVTVNPAGAACYWTLQPQGPAKWQTPYWIVSVPKEIMRDHSDIFNENSLSLLARLFRLSNPNQAPGITMTARPRTMRLLDPGTTP